MINLQFHHNNVTYKNCLKFLGLVIEIQIKVMLRHNFPFRLFHLQVTTQNTYQEFEEREILQPNQGLKHINMKLEAQLRRNINLFLASISQPLVGKQTRVSKARLDNKAKINLLLSLSMDFYA